MVAGWARILPHVVFRDAVIDGARRAAGVERRRVAQGPSRRRFAPATRPATSGCGVLHVMVISTRGSTGEGRACWIPQHRDSNRSPRAVRRAPLESVQNLAAAAPVGDAGALQVRDDDGRLAGAADAECFVHGVEDGVGLGAHVSGVDGAGCGEGSASASTSSVDAAFAER